MSTSMLYIIISKSFKDLFLLKDSRTEQGRQRTRASSRTHRDLSSVASLPRCLHSSELSSHRAPLLLCACATRWSGDRGARVETTVFPYRVQVLQAVTYVPTYVTRSFKNRQNIVSLPWRSQSCSWGLDGKLCCYLPNWCLR